MDFLVQMDVQLTPDVDERRKDQLVRMEADRAKELAAEGRIQRLWRLPGRWSNVGIWSADDGTSLHEAIASLPFFPWLNVSVIALASHPNDPASSSGPGGDARVANGLLQ